MDIYTIMQAKCPVFVSCFPLNAIPYTLTVITGLAVGLYFSSFSFNMKHAVILLIATWCCFNLVLLLQSENLLLVCLWLNDLALF